MDIDLHRPNRPPAYCFVDFDDPRDAKDAVAGRHGYVFDGHHLRVEFCRGRDRRDRDRDRDRDRERRPNIRHSDYRVRISNLPRSISWQDLKDHMRTAGDICFTDVYRDGTGIVEFSAREGMEAALRKLDKSEIKNPFDRAIIRVKSDVRSRSASPSHSGSGSDSGRSRSPSRSRSKTPPPKRRSRSPSPAVERSKSQTEAEKDSNEPEPKRAKVDDTEDQVSAE